MMARRKLWIMKGPTFCFTFDDSSDLACEYQLFISVSTVPFFYLSSYTVSRLSFSFARLLSCVGVMINGGLSIRI